MDFTRSQSHKANTTTAFGCSTQSTTYMLTIISNEGNVGAAKSQWSRPLSLTLSWISFFYPTQKEGRLHPRHIGSFASFKEIVLEPIDHDCTTSLCSRGHRRLSMYASIRNSGCASPPEVAISVSENPSDHSTCAGYFHHHLYWSHHGLARWTPQVAAEREGLGTVAGQ
jgi:hypothetical protein